MAEHLSIGQVCARVGLDPDTLRYYERRGVVPTPARTGGGRRAYTEADLHLLDVLLNLKRTGMPLDRIAQFTRLVAADPAGVPERLALLREHHRVVTEHLLAWQASLRLIETKIRDYEQRNS
ncbi:MULTISPECIES: MerR family transcriptional regulator [Microbacterium]|uniref:MerR family transcriptional regulator n=1 Tax=Microbacterium TaxID=33882 RepID=UPI0019BE0775|nr:MULTISPECIES: MerR family transcriptional regulator [Microbacterium]MBD3758877.1 MerR family transcriptional regulator [Microbacterium sp.]MBZ6371870.1 MerR family transcriptional regulator [Microbacterium hominis]